MRFGYLRLSRTELTNGGPFFSFTSTFVLSVGKRGGKPIPFSQRLLSFLRYAVPYPAQGIVNFRPARECLAGPSARGPRLVLLALWTIPWRHTRDSSGTARHPFPNPRSGGEAHTLRFSRFLSALSREAFCNFLKQAVLVRTSEHLQPFLSEGVAVSYCG